MHSSRLHKAVLWLLPPLNSSGMLRNTILSFLHSPSARGRLFAPPVNSSFLSLQVFLERLLKMQVTRVILAFAVVIGPAIALPASLAGDCINARERIRDSLEAAPNVNEKRVTESANPFGLGFQLQSDADDKSLSQHVRRTAVSLRAPEPKHSSQQDVNSLLSTSDEEFGRIAHVVGDLEFQLNGHDFISSWVSNKMRSMPQSLINNGNHGLEKEVNFAIPNNNAVTAEKMPKTERIQGIRVH